MFRDSLVEYPYLYQLGHDCLKIYRISHSGHPVLLHDMIFDGSVEALNKFTSGGKDYVVLVGGNLLAVVDVTDPENPDLVYHDAFNGGTDVEIEGSAMYVSTGSKGINIYDISDPELPLYVGNFSYGSNYSGDLVVDGGFLFAAFRVADQEVISLDISDPFDPQLIDVQSFSSLPGKMSMNSYGNRLGVCLSGSSVAFVEVTGSGVFGSVDTKAASGRNAYDIDVYGEYFFVLFNPDSIYAYRVDVSGNIFDSGNYSFSGANLQGMDIDNYGSDIVIIDDFNVLYHKGITGIVSFTDYGGDVEISSVTCLESTNDYIYAAGDRGELAVYSLASTATPGLLYLDPDAGPGFVDMEISFNLFSSTYLFLADNNRTAYSYDL